MAHHRPGLSSAGVPLWFGLCSLEEEGQEQAFVEWMLEQAYEHNPSFAPKAFMIDKDGSEHKAMEAVLLRRALSGLRQFVDALQEKARPASSEGQLAAAQKHLQEREAREEHLDKLATGATRYVRTFYIWLIT